MSGLDDQMPDEGSDDIVAAEYVVGVLPADERLAVQRRVDSDLAFARIVDRWEMQFSPLAQAYPEIEPPASVKAGLDRLITAPASRDAADRRGFWSSLAFWRGLSAASLAALAVAIGISYFHDSVGEPQIRLVASLAADDSDVRYLAVYDAAAGDVSLSHVAGERGVNHDFELWMIEGKTAPVSMGVIPAGTSIHIVVNEAARRKLAQGAVLAVSLEPSGGSPTGQPTGPVVAAGDLRNI